MRRRILPLFIVTALAWTVVVPLGAYDDDTHYYFTYYLSRLVGFTPQQAFRIASADIGIDYASETNPEQYSRVFRALHADVNDRRIRFHAFRDSRVFNDQAMDDQFGAVQAAIDRAGSTLWSAAEQLDNPGVYLHFLQDIGPHDPYLYGSEIGHAIHNHWPDFLSADHVKAERMTRDSIVALTRFMRVCCPHQKSRSVAFERDVRPVLAKLIEVNPAPPLPGGRLGRIMLAKLGLAEQIPGENVDSQTAAVVVKQALAKIGDGDWMPSKVSRTPFEFTSEGTLPDRDLEAIALTGDLTLDVSDPDGKPLGGVVGRLRIGPRVTGESGPIAGAGVSSSNGALTFERLPVGEIEVVLSRPQYRDVIVPVTLDRRERIVGVVLTPAAPNPSSVSSAGRSTLRVRVVDVDTGRDVAADIRAAGRTLAGDRSTFALTSGIATDVTPGVYELSATTAAGETASAWTDAAPGRATDVELRVGDDRANNLAAGIAALRREIGTLLGHPAIARRSDLEAVRPVARRVASILAADRAEAGPLAAELTGVVLPACRELAAARALQPAVVTGAERDADRVESLIGDVGRLSADCADQATLDRARQSYGEAVRLVAGIERIAGRTGVDPDRIRDAAGIVDSSRPLVERATVLAARVRSNLGQADAMRALVSPAMSYNDDVEQRVPAMARRINELRALAAGDPAGLAELAELGGLLDRVEKLPIGSLEAALAEAELADGLVASLERPANALRTCPTDSAADLAALVDRLQTAQMLSQLTLLSEGAECQRGIEACRSKLASARAVPASDGAPPAERRLEDVIVGTREVTITVWDAACEDGDRITVRVNGAPVFLNHELTNRKVSRTITLPSDVNSIEVAATSTGHDCAPQTPPDKRVNTGAVSISGAARGGDQQWTLRDRNSSISRLVVQPGAAPAPSATSVSSQPVPVPTPAAAPLTVGSTNGRVRVTRPGRSGAGPLSAGAAIASGSTLQTGANGRADLRGPDASTIAIGPSTQARLVSAQGGGRHLNLATGLVEVVHPAGAAPVRIVTSHGTIETVGTRFRVERTADGTIVEVVEGALRLTGTAVLRLSMPGQQIGKSAPSSTLVLHAPGRAILLPAPSDASPTLLPAPAASAGIPAVPSVVPAGLPPGPASASNPGGAGSRPSYLPPAGAGGGAPAASLLSRPDPWNDPKVQALVDEWLRTAIPPGGQLGQSWRYSEWGVVLAPGVVAAGPPEHPVGWTRHQTVWAVRDRLASVNLCTLGEFVHRRLGNRPLTGCATR